MMDEWRRVSPIECPKGMRYGMRYYANILNMEASVPIVWVYLMQNSRDKPQCFD